MRIKKISIYFGAQIHEFGWSTSLKYPFHQMNGEIIWNLHSLKHLGHLLKTIWYLKLLQSPWRRAEPKRSQSLKFFEILQTIQLFELFKFIQAPVLGAELKLSNSVKLYFCKIIDYFFKIFKIAMKSLAGRGT